MKTQRIMQLSSAVALVAAGLVVAGPLAHAAGVAAVINAKTIPESTVSVIDPESGTSSGGGTTDVRIGPGDVISFRYKWVAVPDANIRGIMAYLTEYVPANTEVVGVRILDQNGLTIPPRLPGRSLLSCRAGGGSCTTSNYLGSGTGEGSIAQLHGDTGVFYSTDSRLSRNPSNAFLALNNGLTMPDPVYVNFIMTLVGATAPFKVHNAWDLTQVTALGGLSGATPYRYGSPVAGPDTFYSYEVGYTTAPVYNSTVGPWRRIVYPGSTIGIGLAPAGRSPATGWSLVDASSTGFDVTPLAPLPAGTRVVRFALGEARVGEVGWAEVFLRVLATPLDPTMNKDVDCAETFGSDLSSDAGGLDQPWGFHLPAPACVYLNLLFDLDVDKLIIDSTGLLTYTIHGKNLSTQAQSNVYIRLRYTGSEIAYTGVGAGTPAPTVLGTCDDGSGFACLRWGPLSLAASAEYTYAANFNGGGAGQIYKVFANYRSDALPAPGFTTQVISVPKPITITRADVTLSSSFAASPGSATFTGTLRNDGTSSPTYDSLTFWLPTGWTMGTVTVGTTNLTCSAGCGSNNPTFNLALSYGVNQSRSLTFTVTVPASVAAGLYPVDMEVKASQSGYGGSFYTRFDEIAVVPVREPRSATPTVSCPVNVADTTISGTTSEADGTIIRIFFNGIERGQVTASGGRWSFTGFTGTFGPLFAGIEVRASADAPTKNESERSLACFGSTQAGCGDRQDNDGDGLIDFPADPGCDSPTDGSEDNPPPECGDGVDNDNDTFTDWPDDPSCADLMDSTESGAAACGDGVDNDGDGAIDYPADPDCGSASDTSEVARAACQDGADNDGDMLVDFPADPGCHSAFDNDETDNPFSPEDAKARLLIAFDTSGSMNWHTCSNTFTHGDGSAECGGDDLACSECSASGCGNGLPDDSRLAKVKRGISNVVAAFGEVSYSLMRFHQRPVSFACPSSNASLSSGGWQGAGAAPCGGGFSAGDLLVSFGPDNPNDIGRWIDGQDNYSGTPPPGFDQELRGSGTTPLAGILTSALAYLGEVRADDLIAGCRPYRVILVTDGGETCGGDPATAAAALFAAHIPVNVIGFATPDSAIIANLNAIAAAGGTSQAIFANDSTALSTAMATIINESILHEYCNSIDDDCDTLIDEDYPGLGDPCDNGMRGACYRTGTIVCADLWSTECTAPAVTPGTEICNNIDDDCDGLIDDGLTCTCGSVEICNGVDDDCDDTVDEAPLAGVGSPCGIAGAPPSICRAGTIECDSHPEAVPPYGVLRCMNAVDPTAETCNGLDDDCDDVVDGMFEECYDSTDTGCVVGTGCAGQCRSGLKTCTLGFWGQCIGQVVATPELCNGLDDDCDDFTDEDFTLLGTGCDNGQLGVCLATGIYVCAPDGQGVLCTAPHVTPGIEICNGLDDDCDTDGQVDEEPLPPPVGDTCSGTGVCGQGTYRCVDGKLTCVGDQLPTDEVCNGVDDDCDDLVDAEDPTLTGVGGTCTDPGFEQNADQGECEFGEVQCLTSALACVGYIGPSDELCNGLDDDCDGNADNQATCPSPDDLCHEAQCVYHCLGAEQPCPNGFACTTLAEGDYCLREDCNSYPCPANFECDTVTGSCIDQCPAGTCRVGEICRNGDCYDCFDPGFGCPEGKLCSANDDGIGVCLDDPCATVTCDPATEYCASDGQCVPVSCTPACIGGQICRDGACITDLCASASCSGGEKCDPLTGQCATDRCADVGCGADQSCDPTTGQCAACRTVCPDGYLCALQTDHSATCVARPTQPGGSDGGTTPVKAEDCGCRAQRPDRGELVLGGLALLGLILIRRRR